MTDSTDSFQNVAKKQLHYALVVDKNNLVITGKIIVFDNDNHVYNKKYTVCSNGAEPERRHEPKLDAAWSLMM